MPSLHSLIGLPLHRSCSGCSPPELPTFHVFWLMQCGASQFDASDSQGGVALCRCQTCIGDHLRSGWWPPLAGCPTCSLPAMSSSPSTTASPAKHARRAVEWVAGLCRPAVGNASEAQHLQFLEGLVCSRATAQHMNQRRSRPSELMAVQGQHAPEAASEAPSADRHAHSSGRGGAASGKRLLTSPVHTQMRSTEAEKRLKWHGWVLHISKCTTNHHPACLQDCIRLRPSTHSAHR